MAEILYIISIISFVAAGVFALVAVALWFILKIPAVMGDLSGRTARKSIEEMRRSNERSNVEIKKNAKKKSDKIPLKAKKYNPETGLLRENATDKRDINATAMLVNDETEKLDDINVTEPLNTRERRKPSVRIKLINEIILLHTNETI